MSKLRLAASVLLLVFACSCSAESLPSTVPVVEQPASTAAPAPPSSAALPTPSAHAVPAPENKGARPAGPSTVGAVETLVVPTVQRPVRPRDPGAGGPSSSVLSPTSAPAVSLITEPNPGPQGG